MPKHRKDKAIAADISSLPKTDAPPDDLMSSTLNTSAYPVRQRTLPQNANIRIHVSDLIKMDSNYEFCPRERTILHRIGHQYKGSRLSPGFELLFENGNAIHDLVRNKFMEKSPYGSCVWGDWTCICGETKIVGDFKPSNAKCSVCGKPVNKYEEHSLWLPEYKIVGHPDLLLKWNDVLYPVEIKTIDRQDIVFENINAPLGDHLLQNSVYYWMMRYLKYRVSRNIRFIYVDRGTSTLFSGEPYKEFVTQAAPIERIRPLFAKAKRFIEDVEKENALAPRLPRCTDFGCARAKRCDAAAICHNLKRKDFKIVARRVI